MITVARLREILSHFEDEAFVVVEGEGLLMQVTEKNHMDTLRSQDAPAPDAAAPKAEQIAGLRTSIVTLSARRI